MKVSACCFNDFELKQFIRVSATEGGVCEYCSDEVADKLIDIEILKDFFKELLGVFIPKEDGLPLLDLIQRDWNLFSSNVDSENLLSKIIELSEFTNLYASTRVDYNESIIQNVGYWNVLKDDLKWERRFLINADKLEEYAWDTFFIRSFILPINTQLYRARIHYDSSIESLPPEKMKCPPRDESTNGRANPQGIPFLYLCKDKETTLYETRALYLDELSIGTFKVVEGEQVHFVNFTEEFSLYSGVGNLEEYIKSVLLKKLISADLSMPIRRYDSELEYIPTQFICEYIKYITGADGIIFNSSLHKGGKNIVLFNPDKVECVGVETCRVSSVSIGV